MVPVAYNAHYSSKYLQTFTLHHISTNCSSINKGTIPEVLANTVFIFSTAPSFLARSKSRSVSRLAQVREGAFALEPLPALCLSPGWGGWAVGTPGAEQRAVSCPRPAARGVTHLTLCHGDAPLALRCSAHPARRQAGSVLIPDLCRVPGSAV